ncbi:MAG: hypothetical protein HQL69_19390 [Magnetococcales bacterium]|nr:hypothetical protein [Magnetococcales bacterium]
MKLSLTNQKHNANTFIVPVYTFVNQNRNIAIVHGLHLHLANQTLCNNPNCCTKPILTATGMGFTKYYLTVIESRENR